MIKRGSLIKSISIVATFFVAGNIAQGTVRAELDALYGELGTFLREKFLERQKNPDRTESSPNSDTSEVGEQVMSFFCDPL
jgi:hypothetical protein